MSHFPNNLIIFGFSFTAYLSAGLAPRVNTTSQIQLNISQNSHHPGTAQKLLFALLNYY